MSATDTFNRADTSAGLGTASDGTHTWTAQQGTFGITSNVAYMVSNGGSTLPGLGFVAITYVDGGLSDCTVQATIYNASALVVRWVDASNFIVIGGGGGIDGIWQESAGSPTQLASWTAVTDGTVLKAVLSGTSISVFGNGALLGSGTSSVGTTSTKHGLYGKNPGTTADRWDDFSIAVPVVTPYTRPHINVIRQATRRASVI